MGGGSLGTPNLYYVIYGRPLKSRLHQKYFKGQVCHFIGPRFEKTDIQLPTLFSHFHFLF